MYAVLFLEILHMWHFYQNTKFLLIYHNFISLSIFFFIKYQQSSLFFSSFSFKINHAETVKLLMY